MVGMVVVCALMYPVGAYAESPLEYAVFDPEAGTLTLEFDGQPAYGNLTLRPDGADSFLTYDVDSERPNVLELDTEALEQFRDIRCPTLHVGAGSFLDANGAPNDNYTAPLWVVPYDEWEPPRPGIDVSCTLTYRIVESSFTHSNYLLNAVHDGLAAWSELNPDLKLRYVEDSTANISIEFADLGSLSMKGAGCVDCLYTLATENPYQRCSGGLVDTSRGAVFLLGCQISEYNLLRDTVAHEFGHNLGLLHNNSTDHLMYSEGDLLQTPYDDLDYNIPSMLGVWPIEESSSDASDEFAKAIAVPMAIGVAIALIIVAYGRRRPHI